MRDRHPAGEDHARRGDRSPPAPRGRTRRGSAPRTTWRGGPAGRGGRPGSSRSPPGRIPPRRGGARRAGARSPAPGRRGTWQGALRARLRPATTRSSPRSRRRRRATRPTRASGPPGRGPRRRSSRSRRARGRPAREGRAGRAGRGGRRRGRRGPRGPGGPGGGRGRSSGEVAEDRLQVLVGRLERGDLEALLDHRRPPGRRPRRAGRSSPRGARRPRSTRRTPSSSSSRRARSAGDGVAMRIVSGCSGSSRRISPTVPSASTRPFWSRSTRSARPSTSWRMWLETRTQRPSAPRSRITRPISRRPRGRAR